MASKHSSADFDGTFLVSGLGSSVKVCTRCRGKVASDWRKLEHSLQRSASQCLFTIGAATCADLACRSLSLCLAWKTSSGTRGATGTGKLLLTSSSSGSSKAYSSSASACKSDRCTWGCGAGRGGSSLAAGRRASRWRKFKALSSLCCCCHLSSRRRAENCKELFYRKCPLAPRAVSDGTIKIFHDVT